MTTIVLADDHPIVREGLRRLLKTQPQFTIIGEAENGRSALELIEQLQPDIAFVDLMMPDLNGLEVTRRGLRASPTTRVVLLSMYSDEPHVLEALRSGVMAYILKGVSAETLLFGIHEVLAGRRYLSPPLSDRAVEVYSSLAGATGGPTDDYDLLTLRELCRDRRDAHHQSTHRRDTSYEPHAQARAQNLRRHHTLRCRARPD